MSEQPAKQTTVRLPTKKQTAAETALDDWFQKQRLASVDNLETAARQIIGLSSTILTVLLGLMALTEETLPSYMAKPSIQWISWIGLIGLAAGLACALMVVYPRPIHTTNSPEDQQNDFDALLAFKSRWLGRSVIGFGLGMASLVIVISIVLDQVI